MVSSELFGAKEMKRWAELVVRGIERDTVKALNSTSKKLVDKARSYSGTPKSKRVQNSIKSTVEHKKRESATLSFFVDPDSPDIMLPSKRYGLWNLTWGHNDGTYGNYSRGIISPTANTIGHVEGIKGLKSSDFMGRSWNLHIPKLEKRLEQIFIRLK